MVSVYKRKWRKRESVTHFYLIGKKPERREGVCVYVVASKAVQEVTNRVRDLCSIFCWKAKIILS
jgi:hypothetical protein